MDRWNSSRIMLLCEKDFLMVVSFYLFAVTYFITFIENIAKNSISETMFAPPAVSNRKIYLQSTKRLYCIGDK